MTENILPADLQVRAPEREELEEVTELLVTCDIADYGEADTTVEDLLVEWERKDFELAGDARVVVTSAGAMIAYTDVWKRGSDIYITHNTCVHPAYRGQGIEPYLYHLAENLAGEHCAQFHAGEPCRVSTVSLNAENRHLLEQEGYHLVKQDWRMEITMNEAPPVPHWPEGLHVRTFVPGQDDRAVHQAVMEAFADLGHHRDTGFEEWERSTLKRQDFDPSLCFLVVDGEQVAGVILGYINPDMGWVRHLAVRRPWRGRGCGLNLLFEAFGEYYRRGLPRVGLVVNSRNVTGATRLYVHAGMHVVREFDTYQKILHVGKQADESQARFQ